jgi:hypothetical protein
VAREKGQTKLNYFGQGVSGAYRVGEVGAGRSNTRSAATSVGMCQVASEPQ